MIDSDDKTVSEESEVRHNYFLDIMMMINLPQDEEDESSMMNWVMPMPQIPNLASQTALVNSLVNNQFTKTVENLQVESSKPSSFDNKRRASKSKIVKVCSQSVSDNESLEKILSPNFKIEESLDDLVEGFDSKSVSLNMGSENTATKIYIMTIFLNGSNLSFEKLKS